MEAAHTILLPPYIYVTADDFRQTLALAPDRYAPTQSAQYATASLATFRKRNGPHLLIIDGRGEAAKTAAQAPLHVGPELGKLPFVKAS